MIMNYSQILEKIYNSSHSVSDITNVPDNIKNYIFTIGEYVLTQKGVYTVLITLGIYKIKNPNQDIRFHQSSMENGFSGRTIDTQYITPTLKVLDLPSMAESGWLTRSLEQPYPYTLDYNGHISNKKVKEAFLNIVDFIQKNNSKTENVLRLLLYKVIEIRNKNKIKIVPLSNPEKLTIAKIIKALKHQFSFSYSTFGGSKLPVIAFYSIYTLLINQISRYNKCTLGQLGSHTASDRTSKTAGDIEIYENDTVYEAIEIKLDKAIDKTIVNIAIEKIIRFNPVRYYILSDSGVKNEDKKIIENSINEIKEKHGCQIIINGITPTLKYYLRLIDDLNEFIKIYSNLIEKDCELKNIHKNTWNKIIETDL